MTLLLWLDEEPLRYWSLAYALLSLTTAFAVICALAEPRGGNLRRRAIAGLALLATSTLFAFRWPAFFWEWASNPDEAQMLAQAITFLHAPIPWLGYDPTTSGPLNTMILALPAVIGATPGFVSARVEATLLELGSLVLMCVTLRMLFDDRIACIATIPPFWFFALCRSSDFNGYASELPGLFLLMLIAPVLVAARNAPAGRLNALALLAGSGAGAVPFAKLQLLPLAALALIIFALVLCSRADFPAGLMRAALGRLAAGALIVPGALLIPVAFAGAFRDFVISYLRTPLETLGHNANPFPAMFTSAPDFRGYFIASTAVLTVSIGAVIMLSRVHPLHRTRRASLLAAGALFAAALYSVYQPHRAFQHYLLIVMFPLAIWTGVALGNLLEALAGVVAEHVRPRAIATACLAFLAATCGPTLGAAAATGQNYPGRLAQALADRNGDVPALVTDRVAPGSSVAVWGWMPQYYVVTRTRMATRDSITQFQIRHTSEHSYYLSRYMRDIERSRPRYFVDAVAAGSFAFENTETEGHDSFPELSRYISANYRLVGSSKGVRLYERHAAGR